MSQGYKKSDISAGEEVKPQNPHTLLTGVYTGINTLKGNLELCINGEAIPLLGIYSKEMLIHVPKGDV